MGVLEQGHQSLATQVELYRARLAHERAAYRDTQSELQSERDRVTLLTILGCVFGGTLLVLLFIACGLYNRRRSSASGHLAADDAVVIGCPVSQGAAVAG